MRLELPETLYREEKRRSLNLRQLRIWSIVMIVFALWNVFTPWGLIRRNILAREFPNSEFGIKRAYVNDDMALVIERLGYVDRMAQYTYPQTGEMERAADHDLYTGLQHDSAPRMGSKYMTSGYVIDIRPGSLTLEKIKTSSQQLRDSRPRKDITDTSVPILREDGKADVRSLKELPIDGVAIPDLTIAFEKSPKPEEHALLPGHSYLPFRDSHCYVDPYLYITTDSEQFLHRIQINPDQYSDNWVRRENTVAINLPLDRRYDCYLGHDPTEPVLRLINSDGRISEFDDTSLALLDTYFLEGNWEREYASLFQSTPFYSTEFGIPLTRVQAFRIYRGLAVMLLAGIVILVCGFLPGVSGTANEESEDATAEQANP